MELTKVNEQINYSIMPKKKSVVKIEYKFKNNFNLKKLKRNDELFRDDNLDYKGYQPTNCSKIVNLIFQTTKTVKELKKKYKKRSIIKS